MCQSIEVVPSCWETLQPSAVTSAPVSLSFCPGEHRRRRLRPICIPQTHRRLICTKPHDVMKSRLMLPPTGAGGPCAYLHIQMNSPPHQKSHKQALKSFFGVLDLSLLGVQACSRATPPTNSPPPTSKEEFLPHLSSEVTAKDVIYQTRQPGSDCQ